MYGKSAVKMIGYKIEKYN